jgi:hypothetical protein
MFGKYWLEFQEGWLGNTREKTMLFFLLNSFETDTILRLGELFSS